jgi:hypothetical protein
MARLMSFLRLFIFSLIFVLPAAHAGTYFYPTSSEAYSACAAVGGTCYSGTWTRSECAGTTNDTSGKQHANGDLYLSCQNGWDNSACPTGQSRQYPTGVCGCPSGQYFDGTSCVTQPPDCTSSEISQMCESNICTGTYQPPVNCWLSSSAAPAGCEAGAKTSAGCPAVCLGDSIEDPLTHACIDPTCVGGQTLENHSCVDPTCIGGQTYDSANHSCIDPTCGDGYTLNSTTKQCDFSGCGEGFVQGKIDGSTVCVKSGTTTTGTQTVDVSGTTNQTSTTTTNPDGSQTTTTSGTSTTSGTQSISLDTGGLAQESTVREGVEAQKDLLNLMKGEGANIPGESLGDLYDGSTTPGYSDSLTSFKNRVSASALGSSASGLFTVTLSGSCPSWVIPATDWTPSLTIDQICSPAMTDIWPFIAAILLATATFFAYRIAFL